MADELGSVTPGDLLQVSLTVLPGVDLHPAFGTAKRNINNGTLKGHQGGQGHYFVLTYVIRVTYTSLGRAAAATMLCTVGFQYFDLSVNFNGVMDLVNAVTDSNLFQKACI